MGMFELLSLIGGGIMRLAPVLLDLFKNRQDHRHELERVDREIALENARGQNKDREIAAVTAQQVDTSWANALSEALKGEAAPKVSSGHPLLDWLSQSVRPVLTYWWCIGLYTGHKVVLIVVGIQEKMRLAELAPILLTDFDRGVVGSIIGFWFVDRALRTFGGRQ